MVPSAETVFYRNDETGLEGSRRGGKGGGSRDGGGEGATESVNIINSRLTLVLFPSNKACATPHQTETVQCQHNVSLWEGGWGARGVGGGG